MGQYNPNDPIATLFERFDECRAVARANGTPFSDAQLVQKFITLMEKTGVYNDQLEEWEQLPAHERVWQRAEAFWLKKHLARRNRTTATMQAAGYHNPFANLADGAVDGDSTGGSAGLEDVSLVAEGFSALARERDSDRALIQQLTDRIAALEGGAALAAQRQFRTPASPPPLPTVYIPPASHPPPYGTNMQAQTQQVQPYAPPHQQQAYQRQSNQQQLYPRQPYQRRGRGRGRRQGNGQNVRYPTGYPPTCVPAQPAQAPNPRKRHDNDWFCWTHGFDVDHPGHMCQRPRPGHQSTATRYNLNQYIHMGRWCTRGEHKTVTPQGRTLQWNRVSPL